MLTGVGSAYINEPVYGLSTDKAEEFVADGLGARYETKLDRMLVVSLGTGTSIVKCDGDDIKHIGGIGIGGGTLQGLSRLLLKTDDIKQVAALAEEGDISHINVLIKDICANPLQGLPMDAIASLWGNAKSNASREDIALGGEPMRTFSTICLQMRKQQRTDCIVNLTKSACRLVYVCESIRPICLRK